MQGLKRVKLQQLFLPSFREVQKELGFMLYIIHHYIRNAVLVFLALNGHELDYTQKELSDLILDVADGKKSYEDILYWVLEHQV